MQISWFLANLLLFCKLQGNRLNFSQLLRDLAAAKLLQSCPTLCDPIDSSPPGSPISGILQARTPEWVAISFSNAWKWKVKVKSLSHVWLSDPMNCSLPGSSVHGTFQGRVLEWNAIAFSHWETLDRCKGLQLPYVVLPSSTSTRITAKSNKLVINKPTWPGVRISLSVWRTLYYGPSNDVVVSLRRVAKDFCSPLPILLGLICVTNIRWMK